VTDQKFLGRTQLGGSIRAGGSDKQRLFSGTASKGYRLSPILTAAIANVICLCLSGSPNALPAMSTRRDHSAIGAQDGASGAKTKRHETRTDDRTLGRIAMASILVVQNG